MSVFDASKLLAHTMTLMGFDTRELPGIRQAMEYVADQLANAGIPVQVLDFGGMPLLEAVVGPQGDGVRELWLHAHLDTVPLMAAGQATPRLEGQLLYGRGGYDMLGAMASFIEVMIALSERPLRKRVRLVCVSDEETFGRGAFPQYAAERQQPDVVITGEPTDLRVATRALGMAVLDVTIGGVPAHSSRPDQARNPWFVVSDVLRAIESIPYAQVTSEWYPAGPMLVPTEGGATTAVNTSPGTLTVAVSARLLPGQDPAVLARQIEALAMPDGFSLEAVPRPFYLASVEVLDDDPYVQLMVDIVAKHHPANTPLVVARNGGSDLGQLPGVNGFEFGPLGAGHHGAKEFLVHTSLGAYAACVLEFVLAADALDAE